MSILNKLKWVASILLVFFIVLVTNVIDRDNFNRLSYSVTTIYQDRIVASDLIFQMSRLIQEKQIAVISSDTAFFNKTNNASNEEISSLIERYGQTKLTGKEKIIFGKLREELRILRQEEQKTKNKETPVLLKSIDQIYQYLNDLSKIQLQEGRRQYFISGQAKDTINLFTQLEIIFLIVMAILIQVVILYKPKKT